MWPRDFELFLGLWLLASPLVFAHDRPELAPWGHDLAVGGLIGTLALLSYAHRLRRAHLFQLLVAAWLVGYGWWQTRGGETPVSQNHILVGLLLGMFAIIPSEALRPPPPWRGRDA